MCVQIPESSNLTLKKVLIITFHVVFYYVKSPMSVDYNVLNSQIEATLPSQIKILFSVPSKIMHKIKPVILFYLNRSSK